MLKPYTHSLIALLLTAGITATVKAQTKVDTLTPASHKLVPAALKPGVRQYLVYSQSPTRKKQLALSYWVRDIKVRERNGEKVITTTQHWYGADTLSYRQFYSVNRAADFAPIYHTETLRNIVKAYNWSGSQITGADTVSLNEAKAFKLDFKAPNFNWNLDVETFEQLPLAAGKAFAINFYDAGIAEPKYVLYKVTGSQTITLLDNAKVDCWVLLTEGKAPNGASYTQTFWISKKAHEFLKEEDSFGGNTRTKIKLPSTAPDVVARFK
jgi:hypothetical protein